MYTVRVFYVDRAPSHKVFNSRWKAIIYGWTINLVGSLLTPMQADLIEED